MFDWLLKRKKAASDPLTVADSSDTQWRRIATALMSGAIDERLLAKLKEDFRKAVATLPKGQEALNSKETVGLAAGQLARLIEDRVAPRKAVKFRADESYDDILFITGFLCVCFTNAFLIGHEETFEITVELALLTGLEIDDYTRSRAAIIKYYNSAGAKRYTEIVHKMALRWWIDPSEVALLDLDEFYRNMLKYIKTA